MLKVLLIEDDKDLADAITEFLQGERYRVEVCADGQEGLNRLKHYEYDVVILDWGLPKTSGLDVCKEVRHARNDTPIIMLTGKKAVDEKEQGLDAGADDYVVKPVHMKELAARIRAVVRRRTSQHTNTLEIGALKLDEKSHSVTLDDSPLNLLPKEFQVLELFMRYPDRVFTTEELTERVWTDDSNVSQEAIRTCIARLRKKISSQDSAGPTIKTIPNTVTALTS